MADRLLGVRLKIERAKQHVVDLDVALRAFYESSPYKVGAKRDPQTRKLVYYVTSVEATPATISLIAGDALQNLRSALDQLAWQLVEANRGTPGRQTSYPVYKGANEYMAGRQAKVQGMSQAAVDLIDATKPYKGGNDALWMLNELNNIDKHRLLLTVGARYGSVNVGADLQREMQRLWGSKQILPAMDIYLTPENRLCPLKAGDELYTTAPDAEVNEKMDFRFEVALSEPQVAEGEPLLETLHQLVQLVEGVVAQFAHLL
jgi:hypothetical protein